VEGPLLDALGGDQTGGGQDPHVLADRRLADAQLLGDEEAADAVANQVAVNLLAEMRPRRAQPLEDRQPPLVGERLQRGDHLSLAWHIATWLIVELTCRERA